LRFLRIGRLVAGATAALSAGLACGAVWSAGGLGGAWLGVAGAGIGAVALGAIALWGAWLSRTLQHAAAELARALGGARECQAELERRVEEQRQQHAGAIAELKKEIGVRQQAEAALRRSDQRLRLAIDTAQMGTWDWDIVQDRIDWGEYNDQLFGLAAGVFGGNLEAFLELVHPTDRELVREEISRAAARASWFRTEFRIFRPKRRLRWLAARGQTYTDDTGRAVRMIGVVQDITERRRSEGALRESEERFRQLAENIREVFWMSAPRKHSMLYVSPAYEDIWGTSCESLYSDPGSFLNTIHPEDRDQVLAALESQAQGTCTDREYRIQRADGQVRWIWDRGFPIRNESGQVYRVAGIAEDITDRKRTEEQIRASLAEKEVLLKEVHHRVKNNLQVISSLLELQSKQIKDAKALELFRESQDRIRSIAVIHEQLYRSPSLAQVDFSEYLQRLTAMLYRSHVTQPSVIRLGTQVERVFLRLQTAIPLGLITHELVSNCLKYAFPGGRGGEVRVELRGAPAAGYRLCVRDNGVGLPREFNPSAGATLGLRLVRMLTNQLNGSLELRPGGPGTEWTIAFRDQGT
jgi:PAS domain S-box-containing protein